MGGNGHHMHPSFSSSILLPLIEMEMDSCIYGHTDASLTGGGSNKVQAGNNRETRDVLQVKYLLGSDSTFVLCSKCRSLFPTGLVNLCRVPSWFLFCSSFFTHMSPLATVETLDAA